MTAATAIAKSAPFFTVLGISIGRVKGSGSR